MCGLMQKCASPAREAARSSDFPISLHNTNHPTQPHHHQHTHTQETTLAGANCENCPSPIFWWRRGFTTQQGRAHSRRLHSSEAARPAQSFFLPNKVDFDVRKVLKRRRSQSRDRMALSEHGEFCIKRSGLEPAFVFVRLFPALQFQRR
jgi:hypothetical protein